VSSEKQNLEAQPDICCAHAPPTYTVLSCHANLQA